MRKFLVSAVEQSGLENGRFWLIFLGTVYFGLDLVIYYEEAPTLTNGTTRIVAPAYQALELLPGSVPAFGWGCLVSALGLLTGKFSTPMLLRIFHAAASGSWFIVAIFTMAASFTDGAMPSLLLPYFFTLAWLNYHAGIASPPLIKGEVASA